MKSYVYTISLLMCMGLSHSATQVAGGCLFGNKVLEVGEHTFRMKQGCMQMLCDADGQVSFASCPKFNCDYLPNFKITGWIQDLTKEYPNCCRQPVCVSRDPIDYTLYA